MMENIVINQASIDDYFEIVNEFKENFETIPENQIFKKNPPYFMGEKEYKNYIIDNNTFFRVARLKNNFVGFIIGCIEEHRENEYRKYAKVASLYNININKKYRRKRIGTILLRSFEEWAINKKCNRIEFFVWDYNQSAIMFYRNMGYSNQKVTLNKLI